VEKGAREIIRMLKSEGKISVGDKATVYMGTDVYNHLMEAENGERALGKDLHPMTTVPCGVAIDAATEAAASDLTGVDTLKAMSFDLENPIQPQGLLTSSAEIVLIGRRHIEVAVEVTQNDKILLKGRVILVKVRNNKAQELSSVIG